MDLKFRNTNHNGGIRRIPFPSNPINSWCLHKRLKFLLVHFLECPPQLILRINEITAIIRKDYLYILSSSSQAPQCKYEWISVKEMSDLNVYCLTSHASERCSVALDLTPPLFYYERTKHFYSTEREWWSLSNSAVGEICHFCSTNLPRNLRHCTQRKIIFLTAAFPHITQ